MHKRILSFFLAFVLLLSVVPLVTFAAEHQHTFGDNKRGLDMGSLSDEYSCPATFYETPCESLCGYSKYEWTFAGASDSFVDVSGLNALQVYFRWRKWFEQVYGASANLKKMDSSNAGANIPAAGGRNPKGYGDEGKANVNQSGAEILWVEPLGLSYMPDNGFSTNVPQSLVAGRSSSGNTWPSSYIQLVYYFEAPVSGLYYIGSSGNPYDFGTFNYLSENKWSRKDFVSNYNSAYVKSKTISKGEKYYYYTYWLLEDAYQKPFKYSLNNIPIFVEPLGDSSITTTNNITINNNTWNGNIYTDNSTNLTYIYPQYTTINEKNETVTNISNTPIIYNNETKQYYTYDQTTKNYYYITYNAPSPSPTPAPTDPPSPSPAPDPGKPGGDTTGILALLVEIRDNMIQGFLDIKAAFVAGFAELSANFTLAIENLTLNIQNFFFKGMSGSPVDPNIPGGGSISTPETGGSDSSSSGWNWNPLKWLTDLLKDIVEGIIKTIWKLITSLFGFLLWLLSLVGKLFPFIPGQAVLAVTSAVVIVAVIRIIKFITGR